MIPSRRVKELRKITVEAMHRLNTGQAKLDEGNTQELEVARLNAVVYTLDFVAGKMPLDQFHWSVKSQ